MEPDGMDRPPSFLSARDRALIANIRWKICDAALATRIADDWNSGLIMARIAERAGVSVSLAHNALSSMRRAGVRLVERRPVEAVSRAPSTHAVVHAKPPSARTPLARAAIDVPPEHRARLSRLAVFDPLARQALDYIDGRAPSSQPPEGDSSWT